MTILDRQFLKELALNFAFTFAVITAIAVLAMAGVVFHRHPEVDLLLFAALVRYGMVPALSFLLPLSLLIAVVFVYGRASAENEITTLKASGIHPWRVVLPGLFLASLLAGVSFEIEHELAPWALFQANTLPEQQATMKRMLERRIAAQEKVFQFEGNGATCILQWDSHELADRGLILHRVLLESEEPRKKGDARPPEILRLSAESAELSFDERRREVVMALMKPQGLSGKLEGASGGAYVVTFSIDAESDRDRLKYQTTRELLALRERGLEHSDLSGTPQSLLRTYSTGEVDGRIQQRFSRSFTPLVFLLLGVPLALVFRSGNRLVALLLASLIALFVYYPTDLLANVLMKQQLVGPLVACWSGNLLLAGIGLSLLVFVVRR